MATRSIEQEIHSRVRSELPPEAFRRRPLQILWLSLKLSVAVTGTAMVILLPTPWFAALAVGVFLGSLYGSMFFFGHHLLHGSMVRSRLLQDVLMFPCTAALGLSPHLWRVWHHQAHHPFTHVADDDPDHF